MSRWSDEFDEHPIHQLLNQADEYLASEVDNTDAEFGDERRRLRNVLGTLRAVVAGLDPDFYPKQLLDQIHQHFNGQVLNQLRAYSTQKAVNQLRTANDHATQYAPQIFSLAGMSRPQEAQESVSNAQKAFASFAASMESTANETNQRFTKHEAELSAVREKAASLEQTLDGLDTTANDKLAEWQYDFTEMQTAQAQQHSDAQIERDTKFDEFLTEWKTTVESQQNEIATTQADKLQDTLDAFKVIGEETLADVKEKHASIREIHKLVGRDSVAGGYQTSAGEEKAEANRWRWISLACLAAAIIWLGVKYWSGFSTTTAGGLNWPEIITASSLTAVFLVAAGYTSRQSKLHRDNEKLLRSYALETKALDPFIASLEKDEQQAIKAELVRRMFGQQNATGRNKQVKLDEGSMKTIVEKVSDGVTEIVEKVVNKS
ncbi:hypothetical protein [Pontivivens insulae]|uniref:Uncharacterized protein n=1 Tax=Pontivivens insulae TaxID=1639689 RepID=A0A2R8A9T7_9RHOB|nr:hypothetical protein [Pontivivens insulae]RED12897.1 hypothetical protein DFR53_2030 [Pontivivens insulae]SPF28989.1 hypothetical protein POI8812_01294 [Pontivivens insulae]